MQKSTIYAILVIAVPIAIFVYFYNTNAKLKSNLDNSI